MPPPTSPSSLFRSRADSIDAMDILDELMTSFDDNLSAASSSPQHSQQDLHHHPHLTSHPHDDATSRPHSATNTEDPHHHHSTDSPNSTNSHAQDMTWRLSNSVHMELQENARVPTFSANIDRTGSSSVVTPRHLLRMPVTGVQVTDTLPQQRVPGQDRGHATETDTHQETQEFLYNLPNLGEAFLGGQLGSGRYAYHANYANVGALKHPPGVKVNSTVNYNELNPSTGDIKPPILFRDDDASRSDTLEGRSVERHRGNSMDPLLDTHTMMMMDSMVHPMLTEEKKDAANHYDPLLDAMVDPTPLDEIRKRQESAAAKRHLGMRQELLPIPVSASQPNSRNHEGSTVPTSVTEASHNQPPLVRGDGLTHSAIKPVVHTAMQPTPVGFSRTGLERNSLPAAIERASQQKSQYGFGRKHKVPSVPEPLYRKSAPTTTGYTKTVGSHVRPKVGNTASVDDEDDNGNNSGSNNNSGDAYERKKHRAKIARVKLNESIEQLSISIHVAGSQSKERADQWQGIVQPSLSSLLSMPSCFTEATVAADQAKKWDRPSFVGSAAKMIEHLNAQCDLLMRELIAAKAELQEEDHCHKRKADENGGINTADLALKRARVDETLEAQQETTVDLASGNGMDLLLGSFPRVNATITAFLDPMTLARCTLVSKALKRHVSNSVAWNDMAVQRFGFFNVRQWQEKLEDADEGISCQPLRLYKCMDAENVMPHFNHEGMFLLGEARLQGIVSAWTFLVERSNGETLRSCKRPDGQNSFTSLPIIELRTVLQNTGKHDDMVVIREQLQFVDASTRRRGMEMREISWDDRFQKRILNLDGSTRVLGAKPTSDIGRVICQLRLYESAVMQTFIHAQGCSTISKFVQRSNFTKILVQIRDKTTVPLVIPFPRDHSHNLEH